MEVNKPMKELAIVLNVICCTCIIVAAICQVYKLWFYCETKKIKFTTSNTELENGWGNDFTIAAQAQNVGLGPYQV